MPICPGKVRSVLAVLTLVVSAGELLAQANTSYGLDAAPISNVVAQSGSTNTYGVDAVSNFGFHEEVWDRYGSDPTAQVTTHEGHFGRVSPHPLPAVRDLPTDQLDHVALYRAIQQHLTGAVEVTSGPAQPAAKTSVKSSATRPAPTTLRRWRLFGR